MTEDSLIDVWKGFGLNATHFAIERIGTGHINKTFLLKGAQCYVLQAINTQVFTTPAIVEKNIRLAADYLKSNHPDYLFLQPIPSVNEGGDFVYDRSGVPWRLYPYFANSFTINEAESPEQAYKAAVAFGELSYLLRQCNVNDFRPTINRFHDLEWRWEQFEEALLAASDERKKVAAGAIEAAQSFQWLVTQHNEKIASGTLVLRVYHNDTKINNVLFDRATGNTKAVIDLDTLMPGYFIYDLGDLLRTLVSPVSEEEKDLDRIVFRKAFYEAVVDGYLSAWKGELSSEEVRLASFAGPMMIYIMAIRFLADYLRGDTYYHTTYPGQNLVRANNQFKLLALFEKHVHPRP